eukprot:TRINITY_DN10349_c0_g2_i1.p1 TRINITY_DN10349_c0_g2~~TRINITY_DN10349_c0_g2_i1.p1  ORF type:complete len:283 (+),score=50.38 TRINITY_DN10349_c0_g2_i1:141-989(+)
MAAPGDADSGPTSPECRICRISDADMIAPCGCRGSCEWVHKDCLLQWLRRGGGASRGPGQTYRCEICNQPLEVEVVREKNGWLFLNTESVAPVPPCLLVAYLSVYASFMIYLVHMLVETCLLPAARWLVPDASDVEVSEDASQYAFGLLCALKVAILISPFLPRRFESFAREVFFGPLEDTSLKVWPYPWVPVLVSALLSVRALCLDLPASAPPMAGRLRKASVHLNCLSMLQLLRVMHVEGAPVLCGVKGVAWRGATRSAPADATPRGAPESAPTSKLHLD